MMWSKVLGVTVVGLGLVGAVAAYNYFFGTPTVTPATPAVVTPAPATPAPANSAPGTGGSTPVPAAPASPMRLSKKMEDLKEVLGSRYTRHDKWCFAAVLTGATLGQGWEDVLETLAKRIGDVNRRKAVNRIVVKVEGVMLLSHENPDAFTDVIFTFQDSEGRIVTMQCPLDPSPDLVQLTFQFVVGRLKKEDLWAALKILTDIRVERPAVPAAPMPPVGR